jgi:hypothetical protein
MAEVVLVFHGSSLQILAALVFAGEARGNDSNEIRLTVGVRNDQQTPFAIQPHGDPALFIMVIVLKRQGAFIMEDWLRQCEADAQMLEFVGRVLRLVILNFEWLNYAYFICIWKAAITTDGRQEFKRLVGAGEWARTDVFQGFL